MDDQKGCPGRKGVPQASMMLRFGMRDSCRVLSSYGFLSIRKDDLEVVVQVV
jgi:hypothetical protein